MVLDLLCGTSCHGLGLVVLNFIRIKLLYGLYRRISDAIMRYMCYCDIYGAGGDKIDGIVI